MAAATGISIALIVFIIFVAVGIVIPIAIGVYVYRDAANRGMNPLLWTIIAALAPGFVGFIVYLVVRSNHSGARCINCGSSVLPSFVVCPHCGTGLKPTCGNCGFALEADWAVCPGCGTVIEECDRGGVVYEHGSTSDKGLATILIAVIAIPIVLIIIIAIISFAVMSFNTTSLSREYVVDEGAMDVTMNVDSAPVAVEMFEVVAVIDDSVKDVYAVRLNVIENGITVSNETALCADGTNASGQEFYFMCEFPTWADSYFVIECLDENERVIYESEIIHPHESYMKVCIVYEDGAYRVIYG